MTVLVVVALHIVAGAVGFAAGYELARLFFD